MKTRSFGLFLAICGAAVLGAAAQDTLPPPRLALVIGNSAYSGMPRLANPRNDATDIASALEGLGFSVTLVVDANRRTMNQAIIAFREALADDRRSEGFFYFAGHGVQSRENNYLIPVGADIRSEVDLEDEAISAQKVLSSLEEARNRVNLVVLDACRDNPLPASARSASRGLAVVGAAPPETLIIYSTAAGQTADDGEGRNSPFAAAFLAHLADPGDITAAVKRVTADVKRATGGRQTPYVYMGLSQDFVLNATAAAQAGSAPASLQATPQASPVLRLAKTYGSIIVTAATAGTLLVDGVEVGPLSSGAEARLDRVESGQRAVEMRYERGAPEKLTILVAAGAAARVSFHYAPPPLRSDSFVLVKGGEFTMGDAKGKSEDKDDKPAHRVKVKDFLISKYELTQREFAEIMGDGDRFRGIGGKPGNAEVIADWCDAIEFCNKISIQEGLTPCYSLPGQGADPSLWPTDWRKSRADAIVCDWGADGYRLPSEAEWEYAARGGSLSKGYDYAGSNDARLISIAKMVTADFQPGKLPPNELGLYDMSNLSFEWCWDRYSPTYYATSPSEDPKGPDSYPPLAASANGEEVSKSVAHPKTKEETLQGARRVLRGGMFIGGKGKEVYYRFASLVSLNIWNRNANTNIRLVRSAAAR